MVADCWDFAFDFDFGAGATAPVGLLFALKLLFVELPFESFLAATGVEPFGAVWELLLASVIGAGVEALFSVSGGVVSSSLRFLPCLRHGIRGVDRTRTSQGNLKQIIKQFFIDI